MTFKHKPISGSLEITKPNSMVSLDGQSGSGNVGQENGTTEA